MGAMKQQHRQKQDTAAIIYTGKNCDKCGKPLTVEPGQGTEELQMLKDRCSACARMLTRRQSARIYSKRRKAAKADCVRRYRAKVKAEGRAEAAKKPTIQPKKDR